LREAGPTVNVGHLQAVGGTVKSAAAVAPATLADLLAVARRESCPEPRLLCLLVLARLLEAIGAAREDHTCGTLEMERCRLAGPSPLSLVRDAPRDPRRLELAAAADTGPEEGQTAIAAATTAAAAAYVRELLGAAGGRADGALGSLLDALAGGDGSLGDTARALAATREVALVELAAWERAREPQPAPFEGPLPTLSGRPRRPAVTAAGAAQTTTGLATAVPGAERTPALATTRPPRLLLPPRALGLLDLGNRNGRGVVAWATLGPAAVATLLSLLLTSMLLLG
jgi:hypothetical protein